ncbi:MAG: class I SAM-dependent methyltransferase [Desulfobacteraceae bacterium]|nr:MAG: class I SAM-dependent methyltransferase [Desulfobacteraceae bacterium]
MKKQISKIEPAASFAGAKFHPALVQIAGILGEALLPLMPRRARAIAEEGFTLVNGRRRNIIDAVIRAGMAHRALRGGSPDLLAAYHRRFWTGESAREYHERRRAEFVPEFSEILENLNRLLLMHDEFKTLCEIGTGSGQMLEYLAGRLTTVERFIGIDLNPDTIEDNRKRYADAGLEFIAADGEEWIRAHGRSNWVFFSHRGVFEYFPQKKLENMLAFIAREIKPVIFVAIEPVGIDHDLVKEQESVVYGREFSFSHNYPYLFRKAGFEVKHSECKPGPDYRLCVLMAAAF